METNVLHSPDGRCKLSTDLGIVAGLGSIINIKSKLTWEQGVSVHFRTLNYRGFRRDT